MGKKGYISVLNLIRTLYIYIREVCWYWVPETKGSKLMHTDYSPEGVIKEGAYGANLCK